MSATEKTGAPERGKVPLWRDPAKRAIVFQVVALGLVFMLSYWIFSNTQANLHKQSITTGFGFLSKEAGFEIGESLIPYSAADTYLRALLVGLLNTLKVSFIGIVLTAILGIFVGIRAAIQELAPGQAGHRLHRSAAEHPGAPAALLLVWPVPHFASRAAAVIESGVGNLSQQPRLLFPTPRISPGLSRHGGRLAGSLWCQLLAAPVGQGAAG